MFQSFSIKSPLFNSPGLFTIDSEHFLVCEIWFALQSVALLKSFLYLIAQNILPDLPGDVKQQCRTQNKNCFTFIILITVILIFTENLKFC